MPQQVPPKRPGQLPLLHAVERICGDAVSSFKVAPADKEAFYRLKVKELKAMTGGYLTRDAVDEFERQVRDMAPIVNSEPTEQPIPAGIPDDILHVGEAIARRAGAASEQTSYARRSVMADQPPSPGIQRPNWRRWGIMPDATAYDLAALSCDADPDAMRRALRQRRYEEFELRHEVTERHIKSGDLPVYRTDFLGFGDIPYVRLLDFAEFAIRVGWSLPKEFPRSKPTAVEIPTVAAPEKRQSEIEKERTSLLVIIAALADMAELDLDQPTTEAKKIVRVVRRLKASISVGTVTKYLGEARVALDKRAIPEPEDE